MRKTAFRTLLAVALLLGFPILLWHDTVSIDRGHGGVAISSSQKPGSLPISVFVPPTSASTTRPTVAPIAGISDRGSVATLGTSTSSLATSAPLAAQAAQKSSDSPSAYSSGLAAGVFSVAPGFGGGGEVAATALSSSLGNGTAGSGGTGRDFDDETCPLVDQLNLPYP